jgi:nucleoid DNA-binding protein
MSAKTATAKKTTAVKDPMTRSAIVAELAEKTELSNKQVSSVIDELSVLIERHIKKGGLGQFTLAGLLSVRVRLLL